MLVAVILCAASGCATHSDVKVGGAKLGNATPAESPGELTGAELYAINCNRCHPERSPTERTATEWKTILTHMRVRVNLPAAQARAILKYLQENSGS